MAATLLSVWQSDGVELTTGERTELELHRARAARYQKLSGAIRKAADLYPVKGLEIAQHYPAGVLRQSRDLDLVARTPDDVWLAATRLKSAGWEVMGLVIVPLHGKLYPILDLELAVEGSRLIGPDAVHINALEWDGNIWKGAAPRLRMRVPADVPGALVNLLHVVAEGLQRPIRPRDLVDTHVLLAVAPREFSPAWRRMITDHAVWPEWMRLDRALRSFDLQPGPFAPKPYDAALAIRDKAARLLAMGKMLAAPRRGVVALSQLRSYADSSRRVDEHLIANAHRVLTAYGALRSGLPVTGVRISGGRAVDHGSRIRRCDPLVMLDTSAGSFALVPSGFFEEAWLDGAAEALAAPQTAAQASATEAD